MMTSPMELSDAFRRREPSESLTLRRMTWKVVTLWFFGVRYLEISSDLLESEMVMVFGNVDAAEANLLPRTARVVVLADELNWECVKIGFFDASKSALALLFAEEVPDIQVRDNDVVKRGERLLLDRESAVVVGCEPAFHLNTNLAGDASWLGVDADDVVTLVIGRRFVRKDVSAHEISM